MGGIVSKLFGRGYKLNEPGLSTDDTTIREKQGHSKKQQGKTSRYSRTPSTEDVPKPEQSHKEQAPEPSLDQTAANVAAGITQNIVSVEKASAPVESERPKEVKPEPASDQQPAYQPVVDAVKSTAETAANEASEVLQKALSSEHEVANREEPKEEAQLPEPAPAPYQPVVDVLKASAEVAASVAGEIFEKVANVADDHSKTSEEQEKPVQDVKSAEPEQKPFHSKASEEPEKPVQDVKPAEPEQKPFVDVVRETVSECTSSVISGIVDSPPQGPKEPPREAPPPPPDYESDQEPQQPLLDALKSTAAVAASDVLEKLSSSEDTTAKQEEKQVAEEKPKEQPDAPVVDVLKSSARAAVSFASGLLDGTAVSEEPEPTKKLEPFESITSEQPQSVVEMTRAEAEAVAAKIVEEVKAKAEEQLQRITADKETAQDSVHHLTVSDAHSAHHDGDRDRSPTPNEIESAVVKIQAGVRGYLTRKMLHDHPPQHHDDAATHNGNHEHTPTSKSTPSDSSDLVKGSQDDRLQGTQEGNAEEHHESFLSTMSERVADELSHLDPHYTEMAATKIQAAFRGYRVRREMKPDNGPHALHKSEVSQ